MLLPSLIAAQVAACSGGPADQQPSIAIPAAFSQSSPVGEPEALWWRAFGDPLLDRLIAEALNSNLDVRQAVLRVDAARHQARIVDAARQPTIVATAQASDTRLSKTTSFASLLGGSSAPGSSPVGEPGTTVDTYQVGFDASWELDLFGGNRRAVEAAQARTEAATWNRRDAEIILTAEVARGYLNYRALEQRIAIADQLLAVRDEALDYSQVRRRHGLTTTLDERRAERDIAADIAARQDWIAQKGAQAHALAILLARPPLGLTAELAAMSARTSTPRDIPVGLPSELLLRRPDLRAAERDLAAATADIGVAAADLYPSFSLTGAVELVSGSLSRLISGDSFQPTIAAGLVAPLLDGGRRRATVDLKQTRAQQALLTYQGAVLTALKDVEDALSRLSADRSREDQFRVSEAAARDALATTQAQSKAGLATGLDVLAAQALLLSASDRLAQARAATDQDVVALYKALGGGWPPDNGNDRPAADAGGN
ncbi:efflux transporter outer membrane subunit [Brevundimonas sp. NPDC090276]|uniref:efflux transporter outer membrane subunit n=1 Tax=Brevundimonas sp. NPDC090276 TaxID=3363956 RepID=UPI00383AC12D